MLPLRGVNSLSLGFLIRRPRSMTQTHLLPEQSAADYRRTIKSLSSSTLSNRRPVCRLKLVQRKEQHRLIHLERMILLFKSLKNRKQLLRQPELKRWIFRAHLEMHRYISWRTVLLPNVVKWMKYRNDVLGKLVYVNIYLSKISFEQFLHFVLKKHLSVLHHAEYYIRLHFHAYYYMLNYNSCLSFSFLY